MEGQIDIFNFIGKPEEQPEEKTKNVPKQLLYIVDNPVMLCVNCVCQYCVNNQEEVWNKVRPDEVIESCFNCDECYEFTGDYRHRVKSKKYCTDFSLSDYGAARNREYMKLCIERGDDESK